MHLKPLGMSVKRGSRGGLTSPGVEDTGGQKLPPMGLPSCITCSSTLTGRAGMMVCCTRNEGFSASLTCTVQRSSQHTQVRRRGEDRLLWPATPTPPPSPFLSSLGHWIAATERISSTPHAFQSCLPSSLRYFSPDISLKVSITRIHDNNAQQWLEIPGGGPAAVGSRRWWPPRWPGGRRCRRGRVSDDLGGGRRIQACE